MALKYAPALLDLGAVARYKRRFDDGVDAFGQADVVEGLGGGVGDHQSHRVGQTDVFACQDDQAAQDEARVFARIEHLGQPVERCIRVAAAHGLDEGRDGVVVRVAVFVVEHGAALDGFLRHIQRDVDDAILVWGRGFDRQFERV